MVQPSTATAQQLIEAMTAAVPAARPRLDQAQTTELRRLTRLLMESRVGLPESARFRQAKGRALMMPVIPPIRAVRTVLVTGGTGCIGSMLLRQLSNDPSSRIVSISRGVTVPVERVARVEYMKVDIRDEVAVHRVFRAVRPDVVYHLAAVRDPALAEVEVNRTIATNVVGTANLIAAAKAVNVGTFVYASTGKAVRFYTSDVYAATKKIGERLVSNSGLRVPSFVRYTHVVDNSLIMRKLANWCAGGLVRLHDPGIAFYVQSALESAQVLLVAGQRPGLYTIRDLAWPVLLLDLALDVMRESGQVTPIYFCGYEAGYEAAAYPGLYDPDFSGETGPLVNALEAYSATATLGGQLNHVPIVDGDDGVCESAVDQLRSYCAIDSSSHTLRVRLNEVSHDLLGAMLARAEPPHIERLSELATRYPASSREHHVIETAILAQNASYSDVGDAEVLPTSAGLRRRS